MSNRNKSIYNIANLLSISRILATIPLIICFENFTTSISYIRFSIIIVIFIVISDVLDGYLARLSDCVTDFGKVIDPIADKVCLLVVLIYLIDNSSFQYYYFNPFLFFYLLLCIRDIIIIVYGLYNILYKNHVSQASTSGKLFVFLSTLMLILYIYRINDNIALLFYIMAIITMIISTYTYIRKHTKIRIK